MHRNENIAIKARIHRIRCLSDERQGTRRFFEVASLSQSVLHDTIGGSHPLMATLDNALKSGDWNRAVAASRSVVALYDEDALQSPRLTIAHEIEGDILDVAQVQVQAAEKNDDPAQKQVQMAIAAFLAGVALEDALRRLCDARGMEYDPQRTSISKLQAALYQPSKQIEVISSSENKQITALGDTRNKADHGRLNDITHIIARSSRWFWVCAGSLTDTSHSYSFRFQIVLGNVIISQVQLGIASRS
jgi:hypothetical protein